jgi:tetratricopeptide (TPR) repeat protein
MQKFSVIIILAIILAFIVFTASFCTEKKKPDETLPLTYRNLHDTVKYVGMTACRQCHENVYETYLHTGMGSSFDLASRGKSSALYHEHSNIYDEYRNFWYKPFWENDNLKLLEFRLEGKDTVYKRIENITYIVGSGQHTNSHIMNTNGYLTQVPATFYTQKQHWDLPPGFEDGYNTRFSRLIGLECMSCHNGYPAMVLGSENKYTHIPNGIDCERCHGPGELHIKEKFEGKIIDIVNEIDFSIVNPAKLPIDLQFDVCQRCHIQGNAVLKEGMSFFDFKPGMRLSDVMDVYMPLHKGAEEEFIMASHVERLKFSPCYIETTEKIQKGELKPSDPLRPYKNALTCITCHDPHVSVKLTGMEIFNNACKSCHNNDKGDGCSLALNERILKNNNDCNSCHMPRSGTIDIPHVMTTDHFIRKPMREEQVNKVKEFITLAAINNPSPDRVSKGRAFINYFEKFTKDAVYLDSAKTYFPDDNISSLKENIHDLIRISFLRNDFPQIVRLTERAELRPAVLNKKSYDNRDAWTAYRIAEAYSSMGNNAQALIYFEKAATLAPFYPEFLLKYGNTLLATGKATEGKRVYEQLLREYPKHTAALSNLGYFYMAFENNAERALKLYDEALALDPDYELALMNKAGLLINSRQFSEARKVLNKILKQNPDNYQAKSALENIRSM